ncbi:MAG: winged helix-turn-helix transcriptional regulator [Dehalococcoidia bacterium]|nr:winged helix-turn-helix transcriptional regulator [Dehalococcoidia bacterium]MCA9853222.1 winged helix-turn-helix transcriptional regulator [Dehalococcoidia bacterium]
MLPVHPLDALGNPTRRDILRTLRSRPCSVGDLASRFPVSRPAVSRHLRVLRQAGLVTASASGNQAIYAIRPEGFAGAREFIEDFWTEGLSRLEALARE